MNRDLQVLVMHLLGKIPNRPSCMPKVLVYKPQKVHPTLYATPKWIKRQKKKMMVLQELITINSRLQFIKLDGNIDNTKWRK